MSDTPIDVPYYRGPQKLQDILAVVQRPGDFFVHGSLDAPVPRIDVDGVGTLSFPLPDTQAASLIAQCERAPYGRGTETIIDTSIRRVWQLAPQNVAIGGKSWAATLERILATVATGLGYADKNVAADLYKLLVYDKGAFFKEHRDTEKADGMFGTLLIVLPSMHAGGELTIRHAGREAVLALNSSEVSELTFAAFYADCEHEVLPVTQGNRLCLVYNLIRREQRASDERQSLVTPNHEEAIAATTEMLGDFFTGDNTPRKLAWLLEHQYSPGGLSFAALKNADAARAQVLRAAAARADCALHLGIVHIEEYGPAEIVNFDLGQPYSWDVDYGSAEGEIANSDDYKVLEVLDGWQYVDQWVGIDDEAVDFGQIPLDDGEVLPAGALDRELPDKHRIMEATGNEGASFERSYHRAALVIWPGERFVDVLLQTGTPAALAYLENRVEAAASTDERPAVLDEAGKVIATWEREIACKQDSFVLYGDLDFDDEEWEDDLYEEEDPYEEEVSFEDGTGKDAERSRMVALLARLADAGLLERFISAVITKRFDGSEAIALAEAAHVLDTARCGKVFLPLVVNNFRSAPGGCVTLFLQLIRGWCTPLTPDRKTVLHELGAAIVDGLRKLDSGSPPRKKDRRSKAQCAGSVWSEALAQLFEGLAMLNATRLRDDACTAVVTNGEIFEPGTVIVPALQLLHERGQAVVGDSAAERLWLHAADSLLAKTESPPAPPKDWRQIVEIACRCADCRTLERFAEDSTRQSHRFSVRKDRRKHLHWQIQKHRLDMTHVTERKGRPYTLVCEKTRWGYERDCKAYEERLAALAELTTLASNGKGEIAVRLQQAAAARERGLTGGGAGRGSIKNDS